MKKHEYLSLFEKHLSGTASPEEEQALIDYQDEFDLKDYPWDHHTMGEKEKVKALLQRKLEQSIHQSPKIRSIDFKRWGIAAAVLLATLMTLFYTVNTKEKDRHHSAKLSAKPILPGGNKAVLTLADGSSVVLGDEISGKAINQGSTTISTKNKGLLVYQNAGTGDQSKTASLFNTISTPRGGQYQVVLPDGTRVWLNASSSLYFPARFTGRERNVWLKGEAYFEVAKNEHMPFKVQVNGMSVKVLGTHFNIMAYEDEQEVNTTLLEGAVEVSSLSHVKTLRPGQQANLKRSTGVIGIKNANASESIAWKNGNFTFTDDSIETIMRKISRWYDVDVRYTGNLSDKSFAGSISKYEQVSEVLEMLEFTGTIHFKIEGRRITVMP